MTFVAFFCIYVLGYVSENMQLYFTVVNHFMEILAETPKWLYNGNQTAVLSCKAHISQDSAGLFLH